MQDRCARWVSLVDVDGNEAASRVEKTSEVKAANSSLAPTESRPAVDSRRGLRWRVSAVLSCTRAQENVKEVVNVAIYGNREDSNEVIPGAVETLRFSKTSTESWRGDQTLHRPARGAERCRS